MGFHATSTQFWVKAVQVSIPGLPALWTGTPGYTRPASPCACKSSRCTALPWVQAHEPRTHAGYAAFKRSATPPPLLLIVSCCVGACALCVGTSAYLDWTVHLLSWAIEQA